MDLRIEPAAIIDDVRRRVNARRNGLRISGHSIEARGLLDTPRNGLHFRFVERYSSSGSLSEVAPKRFLGRRHRMRFGFSPAWGEG